MRLEDGNVSGPVEGEEEEAGGALAAVVRVEVLRHQTRSLQIERKVLRTNHRLPTLHLLEALRRHLQRVFLPQSLQKINSNSVLHYLFYSR